MARDSRPSVALLLRPARRDEPLPPALHGRLLAIAGDAAVDAGAAPGLPRDAAVPLPPELRGRLLALSRHGEAPRRTPLPDHLRSSGWAVAASYLVAALVLVAIGDPLRWGRDQLDELWRGVGGALPSSTLAAGGLADDLQSELRALRESAGERLEGEAARGRAWVDRAVTSVAERTAAGVAKVSAAVSLPDLTVPDPFTDPSADGSRRSAAGDETSPRPSPGERP